MKALKRNATSCSWVTNVPAPYRRPLWDALARRLRLTVYLLESDRHMARAGRRGSDWRVPAHTAYGVRTLRVLPVSRGENARFAGLEPVGLRTTRSRSVLLGGWDSPVYWQILAVARLRRRRVVAFYESTLATNHHTGGPIARARAVFFRSVDAVVVPGPAAAAAVLSFGVPASRIHVGFNAVDVERFRAGAARARSAAPAIPGNRFLYVGQLIARKNVDLLLQAFAAHPDPEARLRIIGSGPERESLVTMADSLQVADRVEFVAFVPNADLPAVLAESSTLVLPSEEEVWGLVVNEALAAGLQVVVTTTCGVAASVEWMTGVAVCEPSLADVSSALSSAASTWEGPIENPQILRYTPERFAEVFIDALAG